MDAATRRACRGRDQRVFDGALEGFSRNLGVLFALLPVARAHPTPIETPHPATALPLWLVGPGLVARRRVVARGVGLLSRADEAVRRAQSHRPFGASGEREPSAGGTIADNATGGDDLQHPRPARARLLPQDGPGEGGPVGR